MTAIIFTLYESREAADAALANLSRLGVAETQMRLIAERHELTQSELNLVLTDASKALVGGALRGAAAGGLVGALLFGPLGLLGGSALASAAFGVAAGSAYGALGGGLVGASLPERSLGAWLDELSEDAVIVAVTVDDPDEVAVLERFLQRLEAPAREPLTYQSEA